MAVIAPPEALHLPMAEIAQLCERWKIRELALFDNHLETDDVEHGRRVAWLVRFDSDNEWDLFDLGEAGDDFSKLLDRDIDLVQLDLVRNPYRRAFMERDKRVIYCDEPSVEPASASKL